MHREEAIRPKPPSSCADKCIASVHVGSSRVARCITHVQNTSTPQIRTAHQPTSSRRRHGFALTCRAAAWRALLPSLARRVGSAPAANNFLVAPARPAMQALVYGNKWGQNSRMVRRGEKHEAKPACGRHTRKLTERSCHPLLHVPVQRGPSLVVHGIDAPPARTAQVPQQAGHHVLRRRLRR